MPGSVLVSPENCSMAQRKPLSQMRALIRVRQNYDRSGFFCHKSRVHAFQLSESKALDASAAPDYRHVDIASIEASESRSLGPEYVRHSIWKELGLNQLLRSEGVTPQNRMIIETLVPGRLTFPAGERQTRQRAEHRSAVYELIGRPMKRSLNSFYRATDVLFEHKD